MSGRIYDNLTLNITFDQDKNMFVIPKDSINFIFNKLEPFCRRKRLNLVGVPEFVYRIVEAPIFKLKEEKKETPKKEIINKKTPKIEPEEASQ